MNNSKKIKVGDTVVTRNNIVGVVVDKYREPCGYYYLYDIAVLETGRIITTRYVQLDK